MITGHNSHLGPFDLDLISEWVVNLNQANRPARKRTSASSSTTSSAASSPPSSPSVGSFASMLNMPRAGFDSNNAPLPAFPTTPAMMLSMPRMPARASLAKSRRAGDLVRDSSLDMAMDRRAKAASQTRWD